MQEFVARHYTVIAIAPFDEHVVRELSRKGISFIATPLSRNGRNPFEDVWNFMKLFLLLKKQQPNYFFSYTIKPVIYGSLAARLANIPHIYSMITGTGYAFAKQNIVNRLIGRIVKTMLKYTLCFNKKVFFQNKDDAELFLKTKIIRSSSQITIVNGSGVDIDFFKQVPLPKNISFLMIARLLYDKGIREYIEAAALIKKNNPNITFKVAGWIDTNPNAISETELLTWIKNGAIDYLGRLSDVRPAIADATVYVLPSYAEGTPRTVLEAMSMGRPIITTDVPGCRETVVSGINGFLVPAKNVEALYNAMHYFINKSEQSHIMGKKSREIAEQKYDVYKVNQSILTQMNIPT